MNPLPAGNYVIRNMFGCPGYPGYERSSLSGYNWCFLPVNRATRVNGLGIYSPMDTKSDEWELVPVEGEPWVYRIRSPACAKGRTNCYYWYTYKNEWVYADGSPQHKWEIRPYSDGWSIRSKENCRGRKWPCGYYLGFEGGTLSVKYLGAYKDDQHVLFKFFGAHNPVHIG